MPRKLDVTQIFKDNGSELLTPYIDANTKFKFRCKVCSEEGEGIWSNIKKGDASLIGVCLSCRRQNFSTKIPYDVIKKAFEEKGLTLVSTEYKNSKTPLEYICPKCQKNHAYVSWDHLKKEDTLFLCSDCRPQPKITIDIVRREFELKGAQLVSEEYINDHTPLEFICAKCKKNHHFIKWGNYKQGFNSNLHCPSCINYGVYGAPTEEELKEYFESKGATLLSKYVSSTGRLYFTCSMCGKEHYISWEEINRGVNKDLLCKDCQKLAPNPYYSKFLQTSSAILEKRGYSDVLFLRYANEFFNIINKKYSAHHIYPVALYPDLATSLTNCFPLLQEYHDTRAHFICPILGVENPFHLGNAKKSYYDKLSVYPDYVKLPSQQGLSFENINESLITEILEPHQNYLSGELLKKKRFYAESNKLYIPIYAFEFADKIKREIIFSMIRNRLFKYYKDIYAYTNITLQKYGARSLQVVELSTQEARPFFEENHIQGFVGSQYYIGLKTTQGEIVCAMSFGLPRASKDAQWELYRLATKRNSIVMGGADKLWKFFIKNQKPKSCVTFCDIRFSSLYPEETIYPRLGFIYKGTVRPNYKYISKGNKALSRESCQRRFLEKRLEHFDPDLSEVKNMLNNGYHIQYDCGNFKFLWTTLD